MEMIRYIQLAYQDFEPSIGWSHDDKSSTLVIHLPGFKQEQVTVDLDEGENFRVRGKQPIGGNTWRRFSNIYRIPENCNFAGIYAKFENECVYITFPKLISDQVEGEKETGKLISRDEEGEKGGKMADLLAFGTKDSRQVMVNIAAAIMILIGAAMYITNKLRKSTVPSDSSST